MCLCVRVSVCVQNTCFCRRTGWGIKLHLETALVPTVIAEREKVGFEQEEEEEKDEWQEYEKQKEEEETEKKKEAEIDELYDNLKMAFRYEISGFLLLNDAGRVKMGFNTHRWVSATLS